MDESKFDKRLIEAAIAAQSNAYCPYSEYKVGSAVVTPDGQIFSGCNVANASFGVTICAERIAIGSAVAAGCKEFHTVCVVTRDGGTPCGACRQFIYQFGDAIRVLIINNSTQQQRTFSISELLPESFRF